MFGNIRLLLSLQGPYPVDHDPGPRGSEIGRPGVADTYSPSLGRKLSGFHLPADHIERLHGTVDR